MKILTGMFTNKEVRQKLLFTLGMLLIFRLGAGITVPGVNSSALIEALSGNSIFGLMNVLGGGVLERYSLFALGISPYITASIIIQLLSMDVIPALAEWNKQGDIGRKKTEKATRILGLVLALVQAFALTYTFANQYNILNDRTTFSFIFVTIVLAAGTMFTMWIGDQITAKGIGNGTSMIIFTGIVANMPSQFSSTFNSMLSAGESEAMFRGIVNFAIFILMYLLIVVFVIYNETATRKIPIQYASNAARVKTQEVTFMPIKINSAGVIPVIFASSFLMTIITIATYAEPFIKSDWATSTVNFITTNMPYTQPIGFGIYIFMIIVFSFFYANLQIDPKKVSENFSKSGAFIPGVRPGRETHEYVYTVLNRLTITGTLFLIIIASLPIITPMFLDIAASASIALGGTGLIIVVGVALETHKQIESQLVAKTYKGFVKSKK